MNTLLPTLTILCGLLAGAAANWAADHLPPAQTRAADAGRRRRRRLLLAGAILVAFVAVAFLQASDLAGVAIGWLYAAFLLTVLVIDLEHRRVLNSMLAPAAFVVPALSFLPQTPTLQSSLAGGLAGLAMLLLVYVVSHGKLGMGDVKLAGVIGLMLGYPHVVYALLLAMILGALAALLLLAARRATRQSTIAYAPYLSLGALLAMWWFW